MGVASMHTSEVTSRTPHQPDNRVGKQRIRSPRDSCSAVFRWRLGNPLLTDSQIQDFNNGKILIYVFLLAHHEDEMIAGKAYWETETCAYFFGNFTYCTIAHRCALIRLQALDFDSAATSDFHQRRQEKVRHIGPLQLAFDMFSEPLSGHPSVVV